MSLPRTWTYLAVILFLTLVPVWRSAISGVISDDVHAMESLSTAINRALCGSPSSVSTDVQLGTWLRERPDLSATPIVDIVTARWGTVARYCTTVTTPVLNNENSLMLTEAWLLRLAPRRSTTDVSRALFILQMAMLAVLCFACLRTGAGVLMSAGLMQVGLGILLKVQRLSELSMYPFMPCLIALLVGVYILILRAKSPRTFVLLASVLGVLTAYAANMRTSYLPIYAAFFAVSLAGVLFSDDIRGRRTQIAVAASVLFVAGYSAFQLAFIPTNRGPRDSNYSYHVIAHPLVLSLAIPKNPLAVREGIQWNDGAGLQLAQRINPSVGYLRPGYESALFSYYVGLWRKYPHEMFSLYVEKWRIAGPHLVATATTASWNWTTTAILAALAVVTSGFWFTAIFVFLGCASFAGYCVTRAPLLMGACLAAVAGVLLLAEAAIIMPEFALKYHQSFLFISGVLSLSVAQFVLSLGAKSAGWVSDWWTASTPSESARAERTIDSFGEQWNAYPNVDGFYASPALLQDVFGGLMRVDDVARANVVDIGAGAGRFVRAFSEAGAATIVAVEPSSGFDVLVRNTAMTAERVQCVRCEGGRFTTSHEADFAFSYGVLHHISDPRPTVAAMFNALKPGGRACVCVYARETNQMFLTLMKLTRSLTRGLSHGAVETCVSIADKAAAGYMHCCRFLPLPLRDYFLTVFANLTPDARRLVIYQQLKSNYTKYYWQQEVCALLENAGFIDVDFHYRHGYMWTAIATKPRGADGHFSAAGELKQYVRNRR